MKIIISQLKELANKNPFSYKINKLITDAGDVTEINLENVVDNIDIEDSLDLLFQISNSQDKQDAIIFDFIQNVSYAWNDYAKKYIPAKLNFIEDVIYNYRTKFLKVSKEDFNSFIKYHESNIDSIISSCEENKLKQLGDLVLFSMLGKEGWDNLVNSILKETQRAKHILKAIYKLINSENKNNVAKQIQFDIKYSSYLPEKEDKAHKRIILKYFE